MRFQGVSDSRLAEPAFGGFPHVKLRFPKPGKLVLKTGVLKDKISSF